MNSHGFFRVAVASPRMEVGDGGQNSKEIAAVFQNAVTSRASVVVFPELSLTGYTCADLFYQRALLSATLDELKQLAAATANQPALLVVGLPLEVKGRLFNFAALLGKGRVLGLVPKQFLPNTCEYYEQRWFTPGNLLDASHLELFGCEIPCGTDLLFDWVDVRIGIEICEDLWAVQPPSGAMSLAGANLILNPSASTELLGKASYRRELVAQQSARCMAAYAYAAAGPGESTTDVVFSGHGMIAENGEVLAESERFCFDSQLTFADVDLDHVSAERLRNSSFSQATAGRSFRIVNVGLETPVPLSGKLHRKISRQPFVPSDLSRRAESCREIFQIQATGLAKRLRHTGVKRLVIGISGGLDSTLALLAARKAVEITGLPPGSILAVTLPGLGTTERTRSNAETLSRALGAEFIQIPISEAVKVHFSDIGQNPGQHDITFENAQARERTQVLMDLANQRGGIVIGTGDLSEAALGWCTFNGDHMSMYHVNSGVPKTLVRYMVEWCAREPFRELAGEVLRDICATPISPELLPPTATGQVQQKTEDLIGPYELHDFFLYWFVRRQCSPEKILFLAGHAFGSSYTQEEIRRWLELFLNRFFTNQFKRSSMPDGPKVGSVALSPRGDWRMPSDARPTSFLKTLRTTDGG